MDFLCPSIDSICKWNSRLLFLFTYQSALEWPLKQTSVDIWLSWKVVHLCLHSSQVVNAWVWKRRDVSAFFNVSIKPYDSAIKERGPNNDNSARAFKGFRLPRPCAVEECSELKRATSLNHGRQPEASCLSYLTSLDTTTFTLSSIFSLVEAISLAIWERLACEMFTSGFRPWLINVACLTFLIGLKTWLWAPL